MAKNLLTASTLLLLFVPSSGNSNMVSITHRSSLKNGRCNDYSSGLDVVKHDGTHNNINSNDEAEEYVTNFYNQKRIEKRALAAQAVGGIKADHVSQEDDDSLDYNYLDHDSVGGVVQGEPSENYCSGGVGDVKKRQRAFFRRSNVVGSKDVSHKLNDDDEIEGVKLLNTKRPAFLPNTKHHQQVHARDRVASSVRGGSITQQEVSQQQRGNRNNNSLNDDGKQNHRGGNGRYHHARRNHEQCNSQQRPLATFAPRHHRHRDESSSAQYQRHDRTRQVSEVDNFNYSDPDTDDRNDDSEDEYDEHYDYSSNHDANEYNDEAIISSSGSNSMTSHQAGLLRVPCSLRLNSNENTHHTHHSHTNNKSTPIAAYVDTGAQVTVISATAARKVGILHLMDRRYAGRATGVGHCRVLGRIPAGCVVFVLGQHHQRDEEYHDEEGGTTTVQMNGPALTVLEGTVTDGVDMLLGLDVLQDWEATIQMGGSTRQSSMTVKKRGVAEPVVLPFLVGGVEKSRGDEARRRSRRNSSSSASTASHGHQHQRNNRRRRQQQQRLQHATTKTMHGDEVEDEDDDDLFSPVSSDIESDLDILDQSEFTHEFPDEGGRRRVKQCNEKIVHDIEREDELLGVRHSQRYLRHERDGEDDDDELLQDSSDEEEVTFDMSGL